jgi:SET domain
MDTTQLTRNASIDVGPFGMRVSCTRSIIAGERLFAVTGRPLRRPDRYSVQVGAHVHLTPDGAPWSLVNHSCSPNTAIRFDRWELVALRPIDEGEELTWNYLTTEWELSCPFLCGCATDRCERTIRGFRHLKIESRTRLRPLLSPYLRARFLHGLPTPMVAARSRTRSA